jgi:hypothetical protein
MMLGGGAATCPQIHYGHSKSCMTFVIPRLLPIPNSLPSTSMLSDVTPKTPCRRQATLRRFLRQNTGARIPFEGNFQFRS